MAGAVVGGWLLLDSLQGPLTSVLTLGAAAGGLWLLGSSRRPSGRTLPRTAEGWLERCQGVLASFERLEGEPTAAQQQRLEQLEQLRLRQARDHLDVALVGTALPDQALQSGLAAACRAPLPLRLHWTHPLPAYSPDWQWPLLFRHCDHLVYCLALPLKAVDLRWLEALPQGQSVWLLVDRGAGEHWEVRVKELMGQLPERYRERWLAWSPTSPAANRLTMDLAPMAEALARSGSQQLEQTQRRCLEALHASWQVELEALRRRHWQQLLQRTQWTVAAGVVVAPLPSLDLLVLAAANGLMLQEMARLWDCPWSLEQLQAAATELAKAALTLGVVEWSSQALASLVKLHGATWLVGSAIQALSAAYLTRVVGRAMADYLALASGVPEQELAALLQRQAPLLVARAAEQEKLDWSLFLQQGRAWLNQQPALPAS